MLFYLLVAYGLCFGLQNKLPFLYSTGYREDGEPKRLTDKLLHCTYCTGFHTGWMAWLLAWGVEGKLPSEGWAIPASIAVWAFASAVFCYAADALVRWLEANTG
jgi:hypothetical protein